MMGQSYFQMISWQVSIDDAGQIHIKWDNGSSLAILPNEDNFRTLTNEEQLKEIDNFRNEPDICED